MFVRKEVHIIARELEADHRVIVSHLQRLFRWLVDKIYLCDSYRGCRRVLILYVNFQK